MSRKTRRKTYSNLYENDILDLDTLEDLESITPVKENKAIKKATAKTNRPDKKTKQSTPTTSNVKTNPVEATCNKCHNPIVGELISDIYMPHLDKMVPVISYKCDSCGHVGRRSVVSLALPVNQYEKKYFV